MARVRFSSKNNESPRRDPWNRYRPPSSTAKHEHSADDTPMGRTARDVTTRPVASRHTVYSVPSRRDIIMVLGRTNAHRAASADTHTAVALVATGYLATSTVADANPFNATPT